MKRASFVLTLALLVALPALATPPAASFHSVLVPYESVRQALVADDFATARRAAAGLEKAVSALGDSMSAGAAGVSADQVAEVRGLLPELRAAAASLAAAADLASARDAFYALSKPLVRWRGAAGEGPAVVYCPMKKRSWLQPAGETIGNPYYGQKMATCGDVVSK